jgi:hypothetical protein
VALLSPASRPPPVASAESLSDAEEEVSAAATSEVATSEVATSEVATSEVVAGEEHEYLYSAYARDGRHRVCTVGGTEQDPAAPAAAAATSATVPAASNDDNDQRADGNANFEIPVSVPAAAAAVAAVSNDVDDDNDEDEEEEEGIYVPLPIIHARPNSLMRPRSQISVLEMGDSGDGGAVMRHGSGHGGAGAHGGANRASMLMAALQTTGDKSAAANLDTLIDMASQKVFLRVVFVVVFVRGFFSVAQSSTGPCVSFLQQLRVVNLKAIELQQRTKKGWLLKRGGKLGNKGWDRRFFVLENSVLQYVCGRSLFYIKKTLTHTLTYGNAKVFQRRQRQQSAWDGRCA